MYIYAYTCKYLHVCTGIDVHSDTYVDATLLTRAHTTHPHSPSRPHPHTPLPTLQHPPRAIRGKQFLIGAMQRRHMHVCSRRTCMCHRCICMCHMHTRMCHMHSRMCYRHTCIKVYTPTPTRMYTPCNSQIRVHTLMTRKLSLILLSSTRERGLMCLFTHTHTNTHIYALQHTNIGAHLEQDEAAFADWH